MVEQLTLNQRVAGSRLLGSPFTSMTNGRLNGLPFFICHNPPSLQSNAKTNILPGMLIRIREEYVERSHQRTFLIRGKITS